MSKWGEESKDDRCQADEGKGQENRRIGVDRGKRLASTDEMKGRQASTRIGGGGMEIKTTRSQAVEGKGQEDRRFRVARGKSLASTDDIKGLQAASKTRLRGRRTPLSKSRSPSVQ